MWVVNKFLLLVRHLKLSCLQIRMIEKENASTGVISYTLKVNGNILEGDALHQKYLCVV